MEILSSIVTTLPIVQYTIDILDYAKIGDKN